MRIAAHGLACVRGGRTLFEGVELTLDAGGAALVSGPNGAGKSSLIRILAGLLTPGAGTVTRDGAIALLTESAALDGERLLADALGFWAGIDGRRAMVPSALAAVGLGHLAQVPVRWLSTGQRRRAALARVIAGGAPIWLLDEPANGLDADAVTELEAIVADHRASGGIAIVATHLPLTLPGAVELRL